MLLAPTLRLNHWWAHCFSFTVAMVQLHMLTCVTFHMDCQYPADPQQPQRKKNIFFVAIYEHVLWNNILCHATLLKKCETFLCAIFQKFDTNELNHAVGNIHSRVHVQHSSRLDEISGWRIPLPGYRLHHNANKKHTQKSTLTRNQPNKNTNNHTKQRKTVRRPGQNYEGETSYRLLSHSVQLLHPSLQSIHNHVMYPVSTPVQCSLQMLKRQSNPKNEYSFAGCCLGRSQTEMSKSTCKN